MKKFTVKPENALTQEILDGFNHDAESIYEALNINGEETNNMVTDVLRRFSEKEDMTKGSHFIAELATQLPVHVLALLAHEHINRCMDEAKRDPLMQLMRDLGIGGSELE